MDCMTTCSVVVHTGKMQVDVHVHASVLTVLHMLKTIEAVDDVRNTVVKRFADDLEVVGTCSVFR